MSNEVLTFSPNELSDKDIEACISLLKDGGGVNPRTMAMELPHAMLLAIIREGNEIVGVGAIKRKRPKYARLIGKKSGFHFNSKIHELGYIALKESHRSLGLSYDITAKLLAEFRDRPLFATCSNEHMKRTLEKAGFVRRGNGWLGLRGEFTLWIVDADSSEKHDHGVHRLLRIWMSN
jgi:hypothetical protein